MAIFASEYDNDYFALKWSYAFGWGGGLCMFAALVFNIIGASREKRDRVSYWDILLVNLWIIHLLRTENFSKTNISYPNIRTSTCAYQGVRNVSFPENFAYVLNESSLTTSSRRQLSLNCQITFEKCLSGIIEIQAKRLLPSQHLPVQCQQ